MPVTLSRRVTLLLVVLGSLVVFRCSRPATRGECPPPDPSHYQPVISVTNVGGDLKAEPRTAIVWDVEPQNPHANLKWTAGEPVGASARSKQPVRVTWRGPDGLLVKFKDTPKDKACVTPPQCKGTECTATVLPLVGGKARSCTYEMFTSQQKDEDADIVVTVCCW